MSRVIAPSTISLALAIALCGCKTQVSQTKDEAVADDLIITARADSSLDLGFGIDAASLETRRKCIEEGASAARADAAAAPAGGGAADTGLSLDGDDEDAVYANCSKQRTADACIAVKFCKDEASLNAALSTSVKAAGMYQNFRFGASSSSSHSVATSNEKSYLVIKATYIKSVKALDVPVIRGDIMSTLAAGTEESKRQFLTTCGDKYVQYVSLGGELIAVAELKKDSAEAKFAQENQLKIKELTTGIAATASTSASVTAARSLMQTSVQVAETSGDATVAMNLEDAIKKVQNFKKAINDNPSPSIMSLGLQPYSTASVRDSSGQVNLVSSDLLPMRARVSTAYGRDHLQNMFSTLDTARKMHDHYKLLLDYFPDKIDAAFGGDIKVKIDELAQFMQLATEAINLCRNGTNMDCDFPNFDKQAFAPRDPSKLMTLMTTVPLNRRPSGLYCEFDTGAERYVNDVWIHRSGSMMKYQYEVGFWGLNSPVYDIPFTDHAEFFTRYQAGAIASEDLAKFMSETIKRRSGASGSVVGGWGLKSCYVKI